MKNNRKGIALTEIVIGIIFLSAFIVLNVSIYVNAFSNMKDAQKSVFATNVLISELESIKGSTYADVVSETKNLTTSTYRFQVGIVVSDLTYKPNDALPEDPSVDYKSVTVTVTYDASNEQKSISQNVIIVGPAQEIVVPEV